MGKAAAGIQMIQEEQAKSPRKKLPRSKEVALSNFSLLLNVTFPIWEKRVEELHKDVKNPFLLTMIKVLLLETNVGISVVPSTTLGSPFNHSPTASALIITAEISTFCVSLGISTTTGPGRPGRGASRGGGCAAPTAAAVAAAAAVSTAPGWRRWGG